MGTRFNLNKSEQNQIANMITGIASILFGKMDEGVTEPQIDGTFQVTDSNKMVEFSITAKKKDQ